VTTYAVVGKPVTREDGPEKVSGQTCYSGDLILPGMLWGKVLRSPFPHARIVHIDTSGASKLPGVHAVLTGRDLGGMLLTPSDFGVHSRRPPMEAAMRRLWSQLWWYSKPFRS
jgi:CO/xanthine dehydrogenase Mo-binding subunit